MAAAGGRWRRRRNRRPRAPPRRGPGPGAAKGEGGEPGAVASARVTRSVPVRAAGAAPSPHASQPGRGSSQPRPGLLTAGSVSSQPGPRPSRPRRVRGRHQWGLRQDQPLGSAPAPARARCHIWWKENTRESEGSPLLALVSKGKPLWGGGSPALQGCPPKSRVLGGLPGPEAAAITSCCAVTAPFPLLTKTPIQNNDVYGLGDTFGWQEGAFWWPRWVIF